MYQWTRGVQLDARTQEVRQQCGSEELCVQASHLVCQPRLSNGRHVSFSTEETTGGAATATESSLPATPCSYASTVSLDSMPGSPCSLLDEDEATLLRRWATEPLRVEGFAEDEFDDGASPEEEEEDLTTPYDDDSEEEEATSKNPLHLSPLCFKRKRRRRRLVRRRAPFQPSLPFSLCILSS